MYKRTAVILLILFAGLCVAEDTYVALVGGTVIDVTEWGKSTNDIVSATVIIKNDRIIAVGPSDQVAIPKGAKVIDVKGKYILPGLIDSFAVLNNQEYADAFLAYGITSIVGVDGGRRGEMFLKADPGPKIHRLEGVGTDPISTPDLLQAIDELHAKDYQVVLLMYSLTFEQLKAAVEHAHSLGMATIGELATTSYKDGLRAGVDAFVHTTRYSLDTATPEMAEAIANEPFSDSLESAKWKYYFYLASLETSNPVLVKHAKTLGSGAVLIPTMSLLYLDLPEHRNPWDEQMMQRIDPAYVNNPADPGSGRHTYDPEHAAAYRKLAIAEYGLESFYYANGAHYIAGSGTDVWGTMPGFSLHTEMESLGKIGMSNREVLAAATSNTANTLLLEGIGEIKSGNIADIIVLDENPLDDLKALRAIRYLYLEGKEIDLKTLAEQKTFENGDIIEKKPFEFSDELKARVAETKYYETKFIGKSAYANDIEMSEIYYSSDGLKVHGYLAEPKEPGAYPCIIYNRGGNKEFGSLNEGKMLLILARIASWGYVVVGSNYRGNGGGEGLEQFGGEEVNDILNLLPLLEKNAKADASRIGIYGWSRGGMMTYLTLKQTDRIKAAVVGGGLSDLFLMKSDRPEMEEVYADLIPNYIDDKEAALISRSAIRWPEEICKTTPILLLHGTSDWRVIPEMALDLSKAFIDCKQPFRLLLLEGGDHGLNEHKDEVFEQARKWFDRYVRDGAGLPDLEPHGS